MRSYSFPPNFPTPEQAASSLYALVDRAQISANAKSLQRCFASGQFALLFEGTFAQSAVELSPVLMALSADTDTRSGQVATLDELCRHLPVLTLVQTAMPLDELVRHLRSVMLIEVEEAPYLLRFADSQMMSAANKAFTPHQRARFFSGISAWWTVDHCRQVLNEADPGQGAQAEPLSGLPISLDTAQTKVLLDGVANPLLASQMRHLDTSFATSLSHAEQTEFIQRCLDEARDDLVFDEGDIMALALQRWQTHRADAGAPF